MQTDEMIQANEFCLNYHVEMSFLSALHQSGLIEVIPVGEQLCVPLDQLSQLEKMVRLYYEMDINLEGIETITCLLNRINEMQEQIQHLNNRLERYDMEEPVSTEILD